MSLADDVLDRAAGLRERGETFVVATVVRVDPPTSARPGDKALIAADGTLWGWIGGSCSESLVRREALHAMGDGQPRLVKISPDMAPEHEPGVVAHVSTCPSAGSLDVFIDPHLPRPMLLVIGDTPAAHTLIRLGATIGYETCAVHPGAVASDFPEADRVIGSLDLAPARLGATTWAVVATMGHYDEEAIEALLPYEAAYIGLVASRSYALLLSGVWSLGKKLIASVHWPTAVRRALREPKERTARSGAGSQASTGTSSRPWASSGVRIVGSKYSVVKAVPTLNTMASPKASRR